jgi:hypothetical protein
VMVAEERAAVRVAVKVEAAAAASTAAATAAGVAAAARVKGPADRQGRGRILRARRRQAGWSTSDQKDRCSACRAGPS